MTSHISDIAADTLSAGPWQDTLPAGAGMPAAGADTAAYFPPAPLDTIPISPFRRAHASEVFGEESFMPSGTVQPPVEADRPTGGLPVQITVLCLLLLYSYIILRYRHGISQLFRMVFTVRKEDRSADDYNYLFTDFITGLLAAGYIMTGIAAIKAAEVLAGDNVLAVIGRHGPFLILAAAALSLAAVHIVQQLALRITGVVTLSIGFIRRLLSLRRLFFTVMTVSVTPAVLLFALSGDGVAAIPGYIAACVAAVFLIYYIYRSLRLFIEEKVSILLWMLYLCTVEVMPPAMILLSTLRSI